MRLPQMVSQPGSKKAWVLSCLLHGTLLAFLIIGWHPPAKEIEAVRPRYIQAELLQLKPVLEQPSKPAPQPNAKPQSAPKPQVDQEAVRRAEEQKRQEQEKQEQAKAEAEKQRQAQLRKEQEAKAEAEKKRLAEEAERKRQEQLKKEEQAKAEAERKRQEEQRKELERQEQLKREQAEKQRQEQLKEQAEKQRQDELRRQQELANALAMEDDMRAAEANAAQVGTYVDYMASLIASNWSRPPSARRGMEVMLEISLGAAGVVTNVRVVKSSGNAAFDLSAEQAVRKVGQFSRLREMDPAIYQRDFRRINILFRPDDLRM